MAQPSIFSNHIVGLGRSSKSNYKRSVCEGFGPLERFGPLDARKYAYINSQDARVQDLRISLG